MKKMLLVSLAVSASLMAAANVQELAKTQVLQNEVPVVFKGEATPLTKAQSARLVTAPIKKSKVSAVRPLADEENLSAYYYAPNELYYGYALTGFSDDDYVVDFTAQGSDMILIQGPAYAPVTWENASMGATQYSWSYELWQDDDTAEPSVLTSTSENLEVTYNYCQVGFPTLTASDGSGTDNYCLNPNGYAMFGGQGILSLSGMQFGAFMTSTNVAMCAGGLVGGLGINDGEYTGDGAFGVYFGQPAAPYALSTILVCGACEFPAGTQLWADIYTVGDDGMLSEKPIGSAYFEAAEDYVNTAGAGQISVATIPFSAVESDGFIYTPTTLTVDSPIAVVFRGYENVTTFDPIALCNDYKSGVSQYINVVDGEAQPQSGWYDLNGNKQFDEGTDYVIAGAAVYLNATFGWFYPESDRVEETEWGGVVNASTSGETITIPFNSYFYSTATTSSIWSEDGEVDWLDYSLGENADTDVTELTINVDALPSGVTGRKCTITFTPTGSAPYKLTIGQGTVGVESAVVTSAARVSVVGGNFVVNAPESINAVTVYNVAGQAVATSEIAGTTTVDAQSLAKGVYVLRFNDGSTVKVIK